MSPQSFSLRHVFGLALGLSLAACEVTEGTIEESDDFEGPISVLSVGNKKLSVDGAEYRVTIPEGAESFALVVDGSEAPTELMIADLVTTPSGKVVFDFENDISLNRTDATDLLYTLLVSNNPSGVTVEPGDWKIRLRSGGGEFRAPVTLVTKNQPAVDKMLDLNLYFVGLDGFSSELAKSDAGFQAIITAVGDIYESMGVSVRIITYHDITGTDADTYGVIDSDTELSGLFALSPEESNQSLNLFFVEDMTFGTGGLSVLGEAGGVPGPPILQGTPRSGVAVNMGSYLAAIAGGDATLIAEASAELEIIMAHETGHFLGLFHTTERNGRALPDGEIFGEDPLSDTAVCPDSADADADGRLSPTECASYDAGNLMFWSPANDSRALTTLQGMVLAKNPLVH